jgi:tripartite-type tricarboxylate transporter receptor subunit TctC
VERPVNKCVAVFATMFAVVSALATAASHVVAAEPWPAKAVRFIVPTAPAGGPDRVTRTITERLTKKWGVPAVVENRPGAALIVGTEHVAGSAPDGYTLLSTFTTHVQAPFLFKSLRFDPIKDFVAVSQTVAVDTVIAVRGDSPYRSLKEFLDAARVARDPFAYGTTGEGSTFHLYGVALAKAARANLLAVPYKGEAQALADLLGGQIPSSFGTLSTMMPMIRAGRVRALAVAGAERTPALPDLPTFPELGVPQLDARGWFGIFAPAGTPRDVVARISADIGEILRDPEVAKILADQGLIPVGSTPAAFSARVLSDFDKWRQLISDAGIPRQD